ncbi:ATP synthase F1 gamma [Suillus variegatus]|nr:ATP synthase F1 gamma [Suillus variegatus]
MPATWLRLREIELRLKSVKNIEKITKSMKMIASTKLAKAQRAMQSGKQYGLANSGAFLFVVSSDKGLCGGIHSSVSKATRRAIADTEKPVDSDSPIMVIGDKSKVQLSRVLAKNLAMSFNQIGRDIPTFADAAGVADLIVKSDVKYDGISIVYNKFVSANALKESAGFRAYEMEDDVTKDLADRNAMDNASKNAKDMIDRLTMQYNRGRQAAITNELVDIITGASAL